MFLKSAWYVAGWTSEFEAGQLFARRIIDEPLVMMRREDGALVALEDRCPHRWAPLSLGRIEDDTIRCMTLIYGDSHGFSAGLFAHNLENAGVLSTWQTPIDLPVDFAEVYPPRTWGVTLKKRF